MSDKSDELGMRRDITRREFCESAGLAFGAMAMAASRPEGALAATAASAPPVDYPPLLQGIRGQTDAAFTVPHALRDGHTFPKGNDTGEHYDLVVVGAGMSGLSAAYFYRKAQPEAKILILETCDDFGGHARRDEFEVDGHRLIGKGGTSQIEWPGTYTPEGKALLADIGIDKAAYYRNAAADDANFSKLNLGVAVFFDKETYGHDKLVTGYPQFVSLDSLDAFASNGTTNVNAWAAFLKASPLSASAQAEIRRIIADRADHLPGLTSAQKVAALRRISYADYLAKYLGTGRETLGFLQNQLGGFFLTVGAGPDSFSALLAYGSGMPGFAGMGLPVLKASGMVPDKDIGENIVLPDGNGGVARLIVRWLIPPALPGSTMEDSVGGRVDYTMLDRPTNDVRIRLSAAVTDVRHNGDPASSRSVAVSYVRDGKSYTVSAGVCVLACFNAVVPPICPELPQEQKAALKLAVRKPLVLAVVALKNWRAMARSGVAMFYSPSCFYQAGTIEPSRTLGTNRAISSPDEPAIFSMGIAPSAPGLPQRDQFRVGRAQLLGIDLAMYQSKAREQLQRIFGPYGFDAKRDIAGFTVNRWAHGYAGGVNDLYDSSEPEPAFVRARKRFGRIGIANSDAAGVALTQAAFDQANRAVRELLTEVVRPQFHITAPEQG